MRLSQTLSLAILVLFCASTLASARTRGEIEDLVQRRLKTSASSLLERRHLKNTYFLLKAAVELGLDVAKASADANVCQNLNKLSFDSLNDSEDQLFLLDSSRIAKCNHKDEQKAQQYIDTYSKSNLVSEYFYAVLLGLDLNLVNQGADVCNRATDFLNNDGATVIDTNDKNVRSIYYTPKILEVLYRCGIKPTIVTAVARSLLINTYPIYKNGLTLVEGDSIFTTTANAVNWLLSFDQTKGLKELQTKLANLAFFIQAHVQYVVDPKDIFAYARVSPKIQNIPFFELTSKVLDLSNKGKWQLTGNVYNIYYQNISAVKQTLGLVTVTATIKETGETIPLVFGNELFSGNVGKDINNPGYYAVQIAVSSAGYNYTIDTQVLVRKSIQVDTVNFDVVKSDKRPRVLSNQVKDQKTLGETLKADQNSYIFVSLKVTGIDNPAEVVVRLINPQYQDATGTVAAKFNKDTYLYEAVLDLGSPDVILPYTAEHTLALYVSDPLSENAIDWSLAKIQISYTKNQQGVPAKESDYKTATEIHHQFPGAKKSSNPIITLAFDGIAAASILIFFVLLSKVKADFGRFPTEGLGPVFASLFVVAIAALLGVLTLFWTHINLFQTLGLLALLVIPTIVVGNLTYNHLTGDQVVHTSTINTQAHTTTTRTSVNDATVAEQEEEDTTVKAEKKGKGTKGKGGKKTKET